MMKTFNRVIGCLVLVIGLTLGTGCAGKVVIPNHPGAVNKVDNALYDGILTARAAIEEAKVQFSTDAGTIRAINNIVPGFNKLQVGYREYHTALVSGKDDPGKLSQLQVELEAFKRSLAAILKTATPGAIQ